MLVNHRLLPFESVETRIHVAEKKAFQEIHLISFGGESQPLGRVLDLSVPNALDRAGAG